MSFINFVKTHRNLFLKIDNTGHSNKCVHSSELFNIFYYINHHIFGTLMRGD